VKFLEIPEMASNPLPQQNNGKEKSRKKLPIISLKFILTRKGEDFAEVLILYCGDFSVHLISAGTPKRNS